MPTFQRNVEQGGLGFRPLSADYLAVTDCPEARAALRRSPTAVIRLLRETVLPV